MLKKIGEFKDTPIMKGNTNEIKGDLLLYKKDIKAEKNGLYILKKRTAANSEDKGKFTDTAYFTTTKVYKLKGNYADTAQEDSTKRQASYKKNNEEAVSLQLPITSDNKLEYLFDKKLDELRLNSTALTEVTQIPPVKDCADMFSHNLTIRKFSAGDYNMSDTVSCRSMFERSAVKEVDFSNCAFEKNVDMSSIFNDCNLLETVNFKNVDFTGVTFDSDSFHSSSLQNIIGPVYNIFSPTVRIAGGKLTEQSIMTIVNGLRTIKEEHGYYDYKIEVMYPVNTPQSFKDEVLRITTNKGWYYAERITLLPR